MKDFAAFSFGDYFPYLRWIDVVGGLVGRLKACHKALDSIFEQILEDRKARIKRGDEIRSDSKADFADILLTVQKDSGLTQEHIKAIMLVWFLFIYLFFINYSLIIALSNRFRLSDNMS